MTTTRSTTVPLIIRGEVIGADLVEYRTFSAPAVGPHIDQLVLRDPLALRDVHELPLGEIVDYLVALGEQLDIDTNVHLQQAVDIAADGYLYSAEILRGVYRALPGMLQRSVLEEVVTQNIGHQHLEGWVDTELHDRRMAVRAFGSRAVHVIAGNSPIIALQTVILNAFARSDAIVKIPANDPYAIIAIARTMADMAPDHPLTRHLSAAYWKGGDSEIEKKLYDPRNIEKIVAWGGFASMRSIRGYLGPGLDLIALDPKLSASIIGEQAFADERSTAEAAARAAADIGYFNQGGCVSARVLYAATGTDEDGIQRANDFGRRVFDEIQRLPASVSSPHPAFDPVLRDELSGIRHSPAFRIYGGRGNEGAVIVSQDTEVVDFADRLDCRVANIVPIPNVSTALSSLTIHTQTVGVYPDELKREIRDECALRGTQRIVSLGHATAAGMAGPHDALQVLSRLVRWIREDTHR
jgi:Acyl-CoA reductase (LuxC)